MTTNPPPESPTEGYVPWLRTRVGSQLIYLVHAAVVVFREDGRILARRCGDFDGWSLPVRAMEVREPLLDTAHRAVRQAADAEAAIQGLVGIYSHPRYNLRYPNGGQAQQWTACFWAEHTGESAASGGHFVEPEVFTRQTHPSHADMVRDALRVRAGEPPPLEPVESFPPLRPYSPILRQHVGHAPIILPGAVAVVEDDQGRFLMTHRVDFDYWDFPSGYTDIGETTTANIVREVREETGLEVEPYAIVGLYSDPCWYYGTFPNGDVAHDLAVIFACRAVGGTLVQEGNDEENTAVAFLLVEEVMAQDRFAATRQTMQDYRDRSRWPHIR